MTGSVIPACRSASSIEPRATEFKVEPRQFEGRLLHELDGALPAQNEFYAELYLHAHSPANAVSLYRSGTRVLENLDGARGVRPHALDERLCAGDHRRAISQSDPGNAAWCHPRCGVGAPGRRACAARGAACKDHRGPAAGGRGADEPRCAALGAGRAQRSAARTAGRGVRLVRPASGRRQAPARGRLPKGRRAKRRRQKSKRSRWRPAPTRGLRTATAVLRICRSAVFGGHFADVEHR